MNRFLLPALLPAAALPLLVDSTLKGAALLALALVCALIMRRASAAARHMVWLAAMLALLLVPLLAAMLPGWRVLPEWAAVKSGSEMPVIPIPDKEAPPALPPVQPPVYPPTDVAFAPAAVSPSLPAPGPLVPANGMPATIIPSSPQVTDAASAVTAVPSHTGWIGTVWIAGCAILLLRLVAAHWMLRRTTNRCETLHEGDELAEALAAAQRESGVRQPVRLLLDTRRTIPVVWGIFHPRLLLPADARTWDEAQLRSVLLHELAHIRRRDTTVQALAGIACALHWFNPLVWFAAWRLHVERERACDDLVLARGVRPSDYAGHLLHVAAEHTAARWTAVCGLAMARKSSLEGRLLAVLSEKLNRRGLTQALTVAAIVLSTAIAIPVAMLRAQAPAAPATPASPPEKSEDTRSTEVPVLVTVSKPDPNLEEKLQWGEPVNGLRAALVRPQALGEPAAHEIFDFKLVVQNVSKAPIHVSSTGATANTRYLKLRDSQGILSAHHDKEAPPVDFTLQPGEAATMRLFRHLTTGDSISGNLDLTFVGEFKIENAPAPAWSGKLVTADTVAIATGYGLMPKGEEAQRLFKLWSASARRNEQIPGAFIGLLAEGINKFAEMNPEWPTTPQLLKMRARCDATHDWSGLDALALLNEITAVQASPIGIALGEEFLRVIRSGKPLPKEFAKAPWGEAQPNGLRLAWLFEPLAEEYPLGTALPARVLIHNSGKEAVVFRANSWNQLGHHATDANGTQINGIGLEYLTLSQPIVFRLAPGEYGEVDAPGIGVGPRNEVKEKEGVRVARYFNVKEGDTITVTTGPLPLYGEIGKTEPGPGTAELWWLEFITDRLKRDLPLPADAKAREYILYHAAMDLFGTPVSSNIVTAFTADQSPGALEALAKRLASRPGQVPFAGSLQSGATTFKVTAPKPDDSKEPRSISTPSEKPPIPAAPAETAGQRVHTVAPGDTVVSLARKYGSSPEQLAKANGLKVNPLLTVGQQLKIPSSPPAASEPAPAPAAPPAAPAPATPASPKQASTQPLFREWQSLARTNGNIPGALIGELKKSVETFVKGNPTWETTPKLTEKLPLLDATHDWEPAAAAKLLDDVLTIQNIGGIGEKWRVERGVRTGSPLPPELTNAPWAEAPPIGLRVAWMVGSGAAEYRLHTPLKSRILVHNAGQQTIVFRTHTWHQSSGTARDAKGEEIPVTGISWTTIPPLVTFRLAPGEYTELTAPGIGLGKDAGRSEWADMRVGTIIEAKEGDEVTFTPGLIPLVAQQGEDSLDGEPRWWQDFILDRLNRELPLPADAANRTRLLDRAVRDLFGNAPTAEETAAFVADKAPTAFDSLAARLAARPNIFQYFGSLASADTRFRVLAADPDEAKKPRVVLGPGEYPLSDKARLVIVGRPVDGRRTNDAVIRFSASPEETKPRADYKLHVPDGYGTWAIVCRPGSGVFWLLSPSGATKVDYSNPAGVQLFAATPGSAEALPEEFRAEARRILTLLSVPAADAAALVATAADANESGFQEAEALYAKADMAAAIPAYRKALEKLPAGKNRILAFYHMGEALRSRAAQHGINEAERQEHLRAAGECDSAVLAGSTISSGPGKYLRITPCEMAVCLLSWRRGEAAFKEAQANNDPAKYNEAIGDFLLSWEIARNPASDIGGNNAEMTARALYWAAKGHALQGDKVRAKDSFQQVLKVEGDKTWQDKARAELKALDTPAPPPPAAPAPRKTTGKPVRTQLSNDNYSAIAVQSDNAHSAFGVHFVLVYPGMFSTGVSDWSNSDGSWGFEGNLHLLDMEKTKAAGKNVDKRVLPLKYTSALPNTLFLDGKAYDLEPPPVFSPDLIKRPSPGRLFLLRDSGDPVQTERIIPLRNELDLPIMGQNALHDAHLADTYAESLRVMAMSGWVLGWDQQNPQQHSDGQRMARLRIFEDGRVFWLPDGRTLKELKVTPGEVQSLLQWLAGEGGVGEWNLKFVTRPDGAMYPQDPVKNTWDRETHLLSFTLGGKRHGLAAESGDPAFKTVSDHLMEFANKAKPADASILPPN